MTEDFLYYIWQHKLFNASGLYTTEGEPVHIMKVGERNTNSGPDFVNAAIRIGDTHWAGDVEIHKKTSDWISHKHTSDKAYNSVILHVVFDHDKNVFTQNGACTPVLELKNYYSKEYYDNYLRLIGNNCWIPCHSTIKGVDSFTISLALQRLALERIELKVDKVRQLLSETKGSWSETFYRLLAYYFGSKLNAMPFELLAKNVNLNIIAKHKNNLLQLEALLLGQAGFLEEDFLDEYPLHLQAEYRFLSHKYNLAPPLEKHLWKFFRLRPCNFPTLRISQFAALMHKSEHLFSKILSTENNPEEIIQNIQCAASAYWNTHYVFDKGHSKSTVKKIGDTFMANIMVNVVAVLLFAYGVEHGEEKYKEGALALLEKIQPENNTIIRNWKDCGITASNTMESQALLQLHQNYCKKKQCLQCSIGYKIINGKFKTEINV